MRKSVPLIISVCCFFLYTLVNFLVFRPGYPNFDLLQNCVPALNFKLLPWHSPYFGIILILASFFGPAIKVLFIVFCLSFFVFNAVLFALAFESRWRGVLYGIVYLLLPATWLLFAELTRDSLAVLCLIAAISFIVLKKENRSLGTLALSLASLLLALAIRPDLAIASFPLIWLVLYLALSEKSRPRLFSRNSLSFISAILLLFTLTSSHLIFKRLYFGKHRIISGTLDHLMLHDLFMKAKLDGTSFAMPGNRKFCVIPKDEVASIGYPTAGRFQELIELKMPRGCRLSRAVRKVWLKSLLANPGTYLRVRLFYAGVLMSGRERLRAFPVSMEIDPHTGIVLNENKIALFGREIVAACIGEGFLKELSPRASQLLRMLKERHDSVFINGYFFLMLCIVSLILCFLSGSMSRLNYLIAICLMLSAVLHLTTLFFIGPVTAYRYLSWFRVASILAFYFSLECYIGRKSA